MPLHKKIGAAIGKIVSKLKRKPKQVTPKKEPLAPKFQLRPKITAEGGPPKKVTPKVTPTKTVSKSKSRDRGGHESLADRRRSREREKKEAEQGEVFGPSTGTGIRQEAERQTGFAATAEKFRGTVRAIGSTLANFNERLGREFVGDLSPEEQKVKAREMALAMVGGGLVKGSIKSVTGIVGGKISAKGAARIGARGNIASQYLDNTKTRILSSEYILKIVQQMKKPYFVAAAVATMVGTYPLAEWARVDNAQVGANIAARDAIETGDPELIKEVMEVRDEIFDITLWEGLARILPGTNLALAFRDATKTAFLQKKVSDKLLADEIIQIEAGETDDDKWDRVRQEQADQEIALIDYYNSERKKLLRWEREARVAGRNDDAAFWAAEQARQRKLEEEERKAIAQFWLDYRRTAQQFREDNSPSRLNFGLL